MTRRAIKSILTQSAPGEVRAAACGDDGRPIYLFSERWSGTQDCARYGTILPARIRTFSDELRGAFCELSSGEQVFLRLSSREGLTEGAALCVQIQSEAREDKLARVSMTEEAPSDRSAFDLWCDGIGIAEQVEVREDRDIVEAAFEDVAEPVVVLPGGGKLHIHRTRALTAVDVDTAGRLEKGSAGARALAINRSAVTEMARQLCLRGLGGLVVLDCVSPINSGAADRVQEVGRAAFNAFGVSHARVLKPSALGLLEVSIPWRFRPIDEVWADNPAETALLKLFRDIQRETEAQPNAFFQLALCDQVWRAYETRRTESDRVLAEAFSGRVSVVKNANDRSEVRRA